MSQFSRESSTRTQRTSSRFRLCSKSSSLLIESEVTASAKRAIPYRLIANLERKSVLLQAGTRFARISEHKKASEPWVALNCSKKSSKLSEKAIFWHIYFDFSDRTSRKARSWLQVSRGHGFSSLQTNLVAIVTNSFFTMMLVNLSSWSGRSSATSCISFSA